MKKYIIILVVIVIISIGYYALSPLFIRKTIDDVSPISNSTDIATSTITATDKVIAEGNFVRKVHEVSGKVLVIETSNGKKILRMENFYTLNGPNLRVYLSKDLTDKDFVDVSALKATDGNVNYELPDNVDIGTYKNVLIWCKDFRVLFGSAELKTKN